MITLDPNEEVVRKVSEKIQEETARGLSEEAMLATGPAFDRLIEQLKKEVLVVPRDVSTFQSSGKTSWENAVIKGPPDPPCTTPG